MFTIKKISYNNSAMEYHITLDTNVDILVEEDTIVELGLYKGKIINSKDLETIEHLNAFAKGKKIVLDYLNKRRTISEVKKFLFTKNISSSLADDIVDWLININLLNDSSFARDFMNDKFNLNSDGPLKISYLLKQKGISSEIISEELRFLSEEDILNKARKLTFKKYKSLASLSPNDKKKIQRYLYGKGYPYNVIRKVLEN